jgi:hypothetical protein
MSKHSNQAQVKVEDQVQAPVEATTEVGDQSNYFAGREQGGKKATPSKIALPAGLSVSGVIKHLAAQGMDRGSIVRYFEAHMGRTIRYQHVRNVLVTAPKKA